MVASTQQLGTDLRQAGTPKLENGAKIAKALRSGIAQIEDVIAQTRVDAEGLATTSPATFQSETRALLDDMSDEINDIGDGFDAVDERFDTSSLENAQEKDPDCNGLD